MKNVDYLIVGQGLAGTVLAYQLIQKGKEIIIFDEYDEHSSSRVAAGLFNPITGKKFVKTWLADELFDYLHEFYPSLENYLESKFFYPTEIFRPFSNPEDQNDWQGKSADVEYAKFVKDVYQKPITDFVISENGGLLLDMGGYVVLPEMLKAARKKFLAEGWLVEERFMSEELNYAHEYITYKDYRAYKVIFCNGHAAHKSKFFEWLPFRPVKGEILYLQSDLDLSRIYNKGCFITPKINGLHKCGSTYDWRDLTTKPTIKARNTIMEKLKALINKEITVVDHKAGVRPSTADRRPLIGIHPDHETIGIFNGLGTKGVSLAPFFSAQFVGSLLGERNIDAPVDIKRYNSLYYKLQSSGKKT